MPHQLQKGPLLPPVHYQAGSFPPAADTIDWARIVPHLGSTAATVARYDATLGVIPNARVLLSPLSTREAVLSSRIEGTRATMNEVLTFEAGGPIESSDIRTDIQEIVNYRRAMSEAERLMETLPVSRRVICQAHRILLDSVRGTGKSPGRFRRVPNWIGPPGCGIDDASFIPPPDQDLPDAMSRWERHANADACDVPDRMVQLAVLHAEFEALHPFLDGNGRLGRMLIPLLLWQWGMIRRPYFFVSGYLEAHRDDYYQALLSVSRDRDWTTWIRFFLTAVRTQAKDDLAKAQSILALYDDLKRRLPDMTRSRHALTALDWIFHRPIFGRTEFTRQAGIPERTARRLLADLRDGGVVAVLRPSSGSLAALLIFGDLLDIAEGRAAV